MNWILIEATHIECTMDDSGIYTIINRKVMGDGSVHVRVDVMKTDGDVPLVSFIGTADNVRKRLIHWIRINMGFCQISMEHASYIGWELNRAAMDADYIQD